MLYYVPSAITGAQLVTRLVGQEVLTQLHGQYPNAEVVVRDVVADNVPHFSLNPTDSEKAQSQEILNEYIQADIIVIGAPMYNFLVPSQLKAWIDRIAVAGVTFRYTANGAEGLYPNKRIIVVGSQGGVHSAKEDFQERYLTQLFKFLGVSEIEVVAAQGVAISAERKETEITQALDTVRTQI